MRVIWTNLPPNSTMQNSMSQLFRVIIEILNLGSKFKLPTRRHHKNPCILVSLSVRLGYAENLYDCQITRLTVLRMRNCCGKYLLLPPAKTWIQFNTLVDSSVKSSSIRLITWPMWSSLFEEIQIEPDVITYILNWHLSWALLNEQVLTLSSVSMLEKMVLVELLHALLTLLGLFCRIRSQISDKSSA